MKKKYKIMKHSYRKEIEEQVAIWVAFHDYYKTTEGKEKNDGCLMLLVKKIIYITNHKDKYKTVKVLPLFKTAKERIKWLNS